MVFISVGAESREFAGDEGWMVKDCIALLYGWMFLEKWRSGVASGPAFVSIVIGIMNSLELGRSLSFPIN